MCLCWSTLAHEIWALVSYWCWIAARVSVYEDSGVLVFWWISGLFSRWVNPVRRPIRTSWTSKALSGLSSCQPGQHTASLFIHHELKTNTRCVFAQSSDAFCARSSATERDEWLEAIAKAIDDYTKKKITFISSRSQEEVKLSICAAVCLNIKSSWMPPW